MTNLTLPSGKLLQLSSPVEMKTYLDKYVIGQEKAKRTICTAIYNHYKRLYLSTQTKFKTKVDKSNILLTGATGSGKTFIVKTLADYIGVPYYIADATTLTKTGYAGADVESILAGLIRAADNNIQTAECGIIFIDEIDKLATRNACSSSTGKDPSAEGVQQGLLKLLEGNKVGVSLKSSQTCSDDSLVYIDTTNILFIGAGSFAGIEGVIKERLNTVNIDNENIMDYLSQEDLRKFGLIPEFIGRFPIIANVNQLTKEDLVRIIHEPENCILNQYATLFAAIDDIQLVITTDAIDLIAETAVKLNTGARALRSIFECVMEDYMFETPGTDIETVEVTASYVKEKLGKRYKNI